VVAMGNNTEVKRQSLQLPRLTRV